LTKEQLSELEAMIKKKRGAGRKPKKRRSK
jgi:hypothetical protein